MGLAKSDRKSNRMKYKKILYLRTDICDKPVIAGGSVSHTIGVIEGFIAAGYEIVCASSSMHEQLQKIPLTALYQLKNPACFGFLRWKINCLLSSIFFTHTVLKNIKNQKIDFIYQRYSVLNCTGVLVSKIKRLKLLVEYNGSEVWVDKYWTKKQLISFRFLIRIIERINLLFADTIVVVSKALKDELIKRNVPEHKILVNPNGVNTKLFDPALLAPARETIRKQLGIESCFVFGFIGTFSVWHGIEVLTEIIPAILAQKENVHFLLIGDGPLFTNFYTQIHSYIQAKKITCTGLLPSEQAREYLAACDAFLSPTQPNPDGTPFFGSPTKIFEYLSMGKPIIASDLDQLNELIYPAFTCNDLENTLTATQQVGITIPATEKKDFIKAACRLIETQNTDLMIMGNAARKKAIEEYDWQKHVEKIIEKATEPKGTLCS